MHEVFCRRHIVLCQQCKEPVPKTEMDSHIEAEHTPVPCDLCGASVEKSVFENHKVRYFNRHRLYNFFFYFVLFRAIKLCNNATLYHVPICVFFRQNSVQSVKWHVPFVKWIAHIVSCLFMKSTVALELNSAPSVQSTS
jgi:hypothetical protein